MNTFLNEGRGGWFVGASKRGALRGLGWASLLLGLSVSSCQGSDVGANRPGDCADGSCEAAGNDEAVETPETDASPQGDADSYAVPSAPLRPLNTCPAGSYYDQRTNTCRVPQCPTGSPICDPEGNGRGVYAADEQGHCLRNDDGQTLFCPEGFVNTPAGVRLRLRGARDADFVYDAPVKAWRVDGAGPEREVSLRRLDAERSKLAIAYTEVARPETYELASGAGLAALRREFSVEAPAEVGGTKAYAYALKLQPLEERPAAGGVWQYRVFYQQKTAAASGTAWRAHCASGGVQAPASFLGGASVNGQTGRVSETSEATAMSCQSGAVATCLAWGYAPWAEQEASGVAERSGLFAACVHAKRAAYLAEVGDPTSFTQNGTRIIRGDTLGINPYPLERLEALWGPNGALCVNRENLRRPELRDALPDMLPPCSIAAAPATAMLATGLPVDAR